nr:MAG TPA: hypothetical protein [Caudoviricetes sp.]
MVKLCYFKIMIHLYIFFLHNLFCLFYLCVA